MVRIRKLSPLVPKGDGRTVAVAPKRADPELLTSEHRAWAERVCRRAGWRCERIEDSRRCEASRATGQRMVADHIIERADGGALYDDANGQCLCVAHNTKKGIEARRARRG
ncbi:HNH endonuclease [Bradyrhizobium oligotrophicum]|uniref:HNH endonuclease n=1 Tax=Bradyrhizobium TaxID=374 RepID=UPI003EB95733